MLYKILFTITLSLIFVVHSIGAQTLKYMMWDPSQLEVEKATIAAFENSNPQLLMIGPLPATTCSCLSEIFLSCL